MSHRQPRRKPRVTMISAAGRHTFTAEQRTRLEASADVTYHRNLKLLAASELARLLDGAEVAGLTPRSVPMLDRAAIGQLPDSLKGVSVFATGVDFIDLAALEERGIRLANLPDYSAISVAEHTIGMLLTLSRRIHLSRDRILGRVPAETSVRGWEVHGKTLGIVGTGRIGSRVARMAQGLGMKVKAHDLRPRELDGVEWVDRAELLRLSDVVSLHVSRHWDAPPLLGRAELARMRSGSLLLNVSRAQLVDEAAVITAVAEGHLTGYAVDDRIRDLERAGRLIQEGRILETGHTAWYSQEVLERGYEAWVENVVTLVQRLFGHPAKGGGADD